jgi:hypothetical protein
MISPLKSKPRYYILSTIDYITRIDVLVIAKNPVDGVVSKPQRFFLTASCEVLRMAGFKEILMVVVRDIFRLKFGQSKEAVALWKEAAASLRTSGYGALNVRLLTDLAGAAYYTVILESTFNSVADWEKAHVAARDNATWKALYAKIIPFTEIGHREILSVIA